MDAREAGVLVRDAVGLRIVPVHGVLVGGVLVVGRRDRRLDLEALAVDPGLGVVDGVGAGRPRGLAQHVGAKRAAGAVHKYVELCRIKSD